MSAGIVPVIGLPRIGQVTEAAFRRVFRGGDIVCDLAGGKILAGAYSRDPGNTPEVSTIRAGMMIGKRTSDSLYAPSILGATTVAFTAGGTSITVSTAVATELVRRIGTSGVFRLVGPPSSAGVVANQLVTYASVVTATGVITITDPGVDYIAGSLLMPTDGSEDILSFIPEGYGVLVTDPVTSSDLNVPLPALPIRGTVVSSQLLPVWPSDTSLRAWIVSKFSLNGLSKFVFDHLF